MNGDHEAVQKGYKVRRLVAVPLMHQYPPAPRNLPSVRIAQRNYWLDVETHCVRRTELVVVVILVPVEMVVPGNQGGAKPGLEVYRRSK